MAPIAQHREDIAITPRKVSFDWTGVPVHFIPGEPFASHGINALHILLPVGENWFCRTYAEALPYLEDGTPLKRDVVAFMRQEAMHSRAHQAVQDYFAQQGVETRPATAFFERQFNAILGDKVYGLFTPKSERMKRWWLTEKLGTIAAIEHFTCVLSVWLFEHSKLEEAGADPTMLDLFRWHCAEEIEHRNVAYDLAIHMTGGKRGALIRAMLRTLPGFYIAVYRANHALRLQDKSYTGKGWFVPQWARASKAGLLPGIGWLTASTKRWFTRHYDPQTEADTQTALDYFETSPVLAKMAAE